MDCSLNDQMTVNIVFMFSRKGGSKKWRYLDNTKHLIFWLCNTKQLNVRHFNTNSEKFLKQEIVPRKKQKRLQKDQYYFV